MNELEQTLAIRVIAERLEANMAPDEVQAYLHRFGIAVGSDPFTSWLQDIRAALQNATKGQLTKIAQQLELDLANVDPILPANWSGSTGIKTFISHAHINRDLATRLGDALSPHGFDCFIAHKDIEPSTEWQEQIQKALDTMNLFVSISTQQGNESIWCQQEIGYAFARRTKILPLKFDVDPAGFIAKIQALNRGSMEAPAVAERIVELLKADPQTSELFSSPTSTSPSAMDDDIPF